ncbi:DHA2 family efflux MFS transporter permease subunit [Weissella halotolerans]|uniref:Transport protein n=1 Tax=Weissella halotolerans DSM 20190 TaxID=1123500 RepID=A0A0R2FYF1_9LACO|nr:DHA2 family efflux MFS transporter permease subunit [Weissella halotolerans]KRN33449.1 transport protein [Weissella halotolerans DSM 20190]
MQDAKISKRLIGAIISAGIMAFSGIVVETAMNITFPTLMQEFGVSTPTVQWMTTIYLLMVAIVVPISSWLKRNFKTRYLFLTAVLLFIAGVVIDASAPVFGALLLGRMIQGIGTGIALPLMFNIILDQVPLPKIGMMMGVGTLIIAVAPAVGPTFGGVVVNSLGWRYIFIILLPFLLVALLMGLKTIDQKEELRKSKFNWVNFFFIVLMFTGFIIAFSNLSSLAEHAVMVAVALALGIVGIIGFIWTSQHSKTPIIDLTVFKNRSFSGHVMSFFIFQLIALGLSFILPNYIQLVNHSTATMAGLMVLPGAVLGAILAPFGGQMLDRLGARKPILTGVTLTLVALILLAVFGRALPDWLICLAYLIFMAGTGFAFGNTMTSGLNQLARQQNADGNAVLNATQQFAGATGTSIAAAVVAMSQKGTAGMTMGTAIGSQHAFMLFIALALILAKATK